jgi:mannose-6-phosphate isomerase-like protein (cupin superfamily)
MQSFDMSSLRERLAQSDDPYLEFLRVPSLSVGVYMLLAGSADRQAPHTEDEVYYVVEGRAKLRVEQEDRDVRPGSVVYVEANADHRFHDIEEDLTVLVFFAPAESSPDEPH